MKSVICLAGRRIDQANAKPPRFPSENADLVTRRLADLFKRETAVALVCSAACGADILALEEAERQQIRFRVVLPFERLRFRSKSVVDRGKEWGPRFDRLADLATQSGDLLVLDDVEQNDDLLFASANSRIRQEAATLVRTLSASSPRLLAVAVWEGQPRPGDDFTWDFLRAAETEGVETRSVLTI